MSGFARNNYLRNNFHDQTGPRRSSPTFPAETLKSVLTLMATSSLNYSLFALHIVIIKNEEVSFSFDKSATET